MWVVLVPRLGTPSKRCLEPVFWACDSYHGTTKDALETAKEIGPQDRGPLRGLHPQVLSEEAYRRLPLMRMIPANDVPSDYRRECLMGRREFPLVEDRMLVVSA